MQIAKRSTCLLAAIKSPSLWNLHGCCAKSDPIHMRQGSSVRGRDILSFHGFKFFGNLLLLCALERKKNEVTDLNTERV